MNNEMVKIVTLCMVISIFHMEASQEKHISLGVGLFFGTVVLRSLVANNLRKKERAHVPFRQVRVKDDLQVELQVYLKARHAKLEKGNIAALQ